MKVAVLSESPADEAAIRILKNGDFQEVVEYLTIALQKKLYAEDPDYEDVTERLGL